MHTLLHEVAQHRLPLAWNLLEIYTWIIRSVNIYVHNLISLQGFADAAAKRWHMLAPEK